MPAAFISLLAPSEFMLPSAAKQHHESKWRRVEVLIPMHGFSMHHPLSKRRRAPARLTLRGTSSRNRTGVSSLWGKRLAARRSWRIVLEPPAGLAPASLAYRARVLRLDEGGLEPMAGIEPALRSYQDRGLPLSDTGVVPAGGVAPPFLPCHGSGLLLTYAGEV